MVTCTTFTTVRNAVAAWRAQGQRVALVPTLGNLHTGHLRLVTQAQAQAERVVVSIFVNPLQFGADEDFLNYPRTLTEDNDKLAEISPDILFTPGLEQIYPQSSAASAYIEVPGLSDILCGAYRPGHFRGVATVVAKLFNIVQPHVALFGEKDYQQLLVIRRMTAELNFSVEIVGVPTVREPDGLALSSRNAYLSGAERARAPLLYQTLLQAAQRVRQGEADFATVEAASMQALQHAGFRVDYFSVRRAEDLAPPAAHDRELIILAAAWLGKARLIDNVRVG